MALCSLSTGRTCTPLWRAASMIVSPAMTRISLLATAMSLPASIAARAGLSPATPTMAIRTMSAPGSVASSSNPSWPEPTATSLPMRPRNSAARTGSNRARWRTPVARACSARPSTLPAAARPTTSMRSGISRATLSALRPMDPVEPRMTTRRGMAGSKHPMTEVQVEIQDGGRETKAVDQIEHPADAGQGLPAVLDGQAPFEQ